MANNQIGYNENNENMGNKKYLDEDGLIKYHELIKTGLSNNYLPVTGGQMKGDIVLPYDYSITMGSSCISLGKGINIGTGIVIWGNRDLSVREGAIYGRELNANTRLAIGTKKSDGTDTLVTIEDGFLSVPKDIIAESTYLRSALKIGSSNKKYIYIGTDNNALEFKNNDESNSFGLEGLQYPLTIKYTDKTNNVITQEYNGDIPGDDNVFNIIDFSSGVYYATTSTTATKVSNPLIIKQGNNTIEYNGQTRQEIVIDDLTEVTYNELVELRDNDNLIPGREYRIIDYMTKANQNGVSVANNKFDIIVKALSTNMLHEDAKACRTKVTSQYASYNDYIINDTRDDFRTITAEYYTNCNILPDQNNQGWRGVKMSSIPTGILNLPDLGFVPGTDTDIRYCELFANGNTALAIKKGSIWVHINYVTGNNRLNTVGVELIDTETDKVVSGDYHIGYTGHQYSNRTYCVECPKDGTYKIVCYIIAHQNYDNGQVNATCNIKSGLFNSKGVYFSNCNLSAWELKYSLDNTSNKFGWQNSNGTGFIYYMKDEHNNECAYDFKNIKYGNHYTFDYEIDGKHIDGSVEYGNLCYNNKLPMDVSGANGKLGLPNIYFRNTINTAQCHSNVMSYDNWDIHFGNNCYSNYVGESTETVSFGNSCTHNIIECSCKSIQLADSCEFNEIGLGCQNIRFEASSSSNIIKEGCNTITFASMCKNNILKNDCTNINFAQQCTCNILEPMCTLINLGENCNYNTFANNCGSQSSSASNTLGNNCNNNNFGAYCYGNTLGENCNYNTFGNACTNNKFNSSCNNNIFGKNSSGNEFGTNCYLNTCKENFISNKFGNWCYNNTFDINCKQNRLGDNCHSNEFGSYCWTNKFGNGIYINKFGYDCSNIEIRVNSTSTDLLNFVSGFEFGNYCKKLHIYPGASVTTADTATKTLKNFRFGNNLGNSSSYTNISLNGSNLESSSDYILGRKYYTNVEYDSYGAITQKCLQDSNYISTSYSSGKLTILLT